MSETVAAPATPDLVRVASSSRPTDTASAPPRPPGFTRREAVIATIGNVVEWYDFVIFGFLALTLSGAFFPTQAPGAGLMSALATFGAGFAARPVGALVFGRLGDRRGRRYVLVVSMSLMAVAAFTIGFAPSYAQAGVLGPAILVLGRVLQGVSAGAEFGSAVAYLVEWAPPGRRGLFGSLHQLGASIGLLGGATVSALTSRALGPQGMLAWGWRLPFLLGGALAIVALLLRLTLRETPVFERAQVAPATLLTRRTAVIGTLRTIGLCALWTVAIFAAVVYMPTYAQHVAGFSAPAAFGATIIGALVLMPATLLGGWATDRWGARRVLAAPTLGFLLFAVPGFAAVAYAHALLPVVALFAALAGLLSGAGPVAMVEVFDAQHRSTWSSIGSALAITLFGGFAPLISTALIEATGWPLAPGLYIIAMAALTGLTLLASRSMTAGAGPG